ncbi:MAG: (Fe-S)-binding protein [Bifidobacteriaceae bacterium]|jgi:Fe-S oxidoreductase|nr:(Fe-S)-binding protein [Bifidobacteriaceae bacterium]
MWYALPVIGLLATVVGWSLLAWRVTSYVRGFRAGAAELPGSRTARPGARTATMLREFLAHTRLRRKPLVAVAHWLTMLSFLVLVLTLAQATGQLFSPSFELPVIGHFAPYAWLTEFFAWAGLLGILVLIAVRLVASRASLGRGSRFFGSHQWRARYVEATILLVCVAVLWLRGLEAALSERGAESASAELLFPSTAWIGSLYGGVTDAALDGWIGCLALFKILVSYAWMVVVSLTPTMGVAWHRFLAFPNLWFAKRPDGAPALGGLEPLVVGGQAVDLNDPATPDDVYEHLGVGYAAELTWRDLLSLTTCTECGRCQEVCPAWATGKALSPKLLVGALRDHAWAEWPVGSMGDAATPLVGGDAPWAVSPEALWACTTCGACTAICPVGVEHVDHVIDLRRRQVLGEAEFPAELGGAFRNLERRQNPWGLPGKKRLDWTAGLDFDVPVLGETVASLAEVDYLYWVGCAGAFDDRGQATARAFAELLHRAGVSFAVLGTAECCTGDPARRAGNESLFGDLAAGNVEVLNQAGATKIVVTCAHCFNSLAGEYGPFGGHYEVVHHTELLADLVEAGRLTPGDLPDEPLDAHGRSVKPSVTYQDPCYLGRHNGKYAAPRRVLGAIGNLELTEMASAGPNSVCCGAGGGRMWLEETEGTRLNQRRADQAAATGAGTIATACPFCAVMLGDAVAADSGSGTQVKDVAQLLLASIAGEGTP